MVKFVDSTSDGLPVKRKQTSHACQTCRKRKKRCEHVHDEGSGTMEPSQPVDQPEDLVSTGRLASRTFSTSAFSSPASPPTPLQSLGPAGLPASPSSQLRTPWQDLRHQLQHHPNYNIPNAQPNTELEFQSVQQRVIPGAGGDNYRAVSEDLEPTTDEESQFVGHTNPQGIFFAAASPTASTTSGGGDKIGFWLSRNAYEHIRKSRAQSSSRPITLAPRPKSATSSGPDEFSALLGIYKTEVYPIFPVVELDVLSETAVTSESSPSKILLMQAVCLAAATSPKARPHLKLPSLADSVQSPKDFISYVSQAILTSFDLGGSRDKLVAAQTLTVLSLFSQLSNDIHLSAEYCGRAVGYVQTMQLHLDTSRFRKDHLAVTRSFLCVWALDRLNAAFHGRPVLMHERDFGRDMASCIAQQESCFQLLLVVVELLDRVIDLYRPSTDRPQDVWVDNFPSFEDLIIRTGSQRAPSHLLATVEILYHAVAMLSCRFNSLDDPDRSSPSCVRQNLSASRVISIVGEEFSNEISVIPFVPYAVSLCLRVSYRMLRVSRVPLLVTRARRQLLTTCALLRQFNVFASANTMADLAEQTVREMDKVAASMMTGRPQDLPEPCMPAHQRVNEQSKACDGGVFEDSATNSHVENRVESNPSAQYAEVGRGSDTLDRREFNPFDFDLDFADLPDLDLFEHFDPGFRLHAVDAALAHNVNISGFADLDCYSETNLTPTDGPPSLYSTNIPLLR